MSPEHNEYVLSTAFHSGWINLDQYHAAVAALQPAMELDVAQLDEAVARQHGRGIERLGIERRQRGHDLVDTGRDGPDLEEAKRVLNDLRALLDVYRALHERREAADQAHADARRMRGDAADQGIAGCVRRWRV